MLQHMRQIRRYGMLLAALLLLGQTASLLHAHDLDKHPDNTQCHICISSTSHGHGLTNSFLSISIVVLSGEIRTNLTQSFFYSLVSTQYQSRAPPDFS